MKNKNLLFVMYTFTILIIFAWSSVFAIGITDDVGIIRKRMKSLGFMVGKIKKIDEGVYRVDVKGFKKSTKAVGMRGRFKRFTLRVYLTKNGLLLLEKAELNKAGIIVNVRYLPEGVRVMLKMKNIK